MPDVFKLVYDRIKTVLNANTPFLALVPAGQFKPDMDLGQQNTGNVLTYGWATSRFDQRAKRGQGVLFFTAASPDGKLKALEIMDKVRSLLTAKTLSDPASVVVHQFREQANTTDQAIDAVQRIAVEARFDVRMIVGPNA